MPEVGDSDALENVYMAKLKALLAEHGTAVDYERDRAAIDTGLHLYATGGDTRQTSQVRVWFQGKGMFASTLTAEQFAVADTVDKSVSLDHLRFWYGAPEPVYLVVYVESVDKFIAEDVVDIVDRQWWGNSFYEAVPATQKTVTVKLDARAVLTSERVAAMLRHRSMRIDGPAFRGRPLGHRLDPLRSKIAPPGPELFSRLVDRLLADHGFRPDDTVELETDLALVHGRLYQTLEWQSPAFSEYGYDPDSDFRIEPRVESLFGPVTLVIDSRPDRLVLDDDVVAAVNEHVAGREAVAVVINANDLSGTGGLWRSTLNNMAAADQPRQRHQLGLEAISNLLLMCTLVYLDFAREIAWNHVNYR